MCFNEMRSATTEASLMLKALVRQDVMHPCLNGRVGPNGSLFPIPKLLEKASLICPLVLFNKELREKPARLELPSVEIVVLIMLLEV